MNRTALFVFVSLAAGVFFFTHLDRIWPPYPADMTMSRAAIESAGRSLLAERGIDVSAHRAAVQIDVGEDALGYLERNFNRDDAGRMAVDYGVVRFIVTFKKPGDPNAVNVQMDPYVRLLSFSQELQRDETGAVLAPDSAAVIAVAECERAFGFDESWPDSNWRRVSSAVIDLPSEERHSAGERTIAPDEGSAAGGVALRDSAPPAGGAMKAATADGALSREAAGAAARIGRRDVFIAYERTVSDSPLVRETIRIAVAGDRVVGLSRALELPAASGRDARARGASTSDMSTLGFGLLAVAGVAGFIIFLRELKGGRAEILRPILLASIVIALLWMTYPFRTAWLMNAWDPLWPYASSAFRALVFAMMSDLRVWIVLVVFIACGDAFDRSSGTARGDSLRAFCGGRWRDRGVSLAAGRGFLVGLLCGGVLVSSVALLETFFGARVGLQPRGFFLYSLNSSAPFLAIPLFFLYTAMLEELGYRFFAGTAIMRASNSKALAIIVPAAVYGLTHAGFDFLPPAEPAWGRVVALTLVGIVWGWAFFRFDALTVILSHWTADIFIFAHPWMSSACPLNRAAAFALIALPLLPALGLLRRRKT